jgi:hypothetical protein
MMADLLPLLLADRCVHHALYFLVKRCRAPIHPIGMEAVTVYVCGALIPPGQIGMKIRPKIGESSTDENEAQTLALTAFKGVKVL